MKTLIVIGDTGMLGSEIVKEANARGIATVGYSSDNIDITDFDKGCYTDDTPLYDNVIGVVCTAVIHDPRSVDIDRYFNVNTFAPIRIARELTNNGIPFHFISSDCVFSYYDYEIEGDDAAAEWEKQRPFSTYGASKALAETLLLANWSNIFIYRCANMFGATKCRGKDYPNVVDRMVEDAFNGVERTWTTGRSSVTYAKDAARSIVSIAARCAHHEPRVFHTVQNGRYSMDDVAMHVYKRLGKDPSRVIRGGNPKASALRCSFSEMMMMEEAVDAYLKEVGLID